MRHTLFARLVFLSIWLLYVSTATAEFYKYRDKSGNIHFVDELSKIPPEFQEDAKVYEEPSDHLSDKEKLNLQYQQRMQEEKSKQELKDRMRERKEAEKKQKESIKKQKRLKSLVTSVIIKGNQVLVPVKVSFGTKEMTALMVLDTGAEIVVLHKDFADQLNVRSFKKAKATVASGKTVQVGIAKLSYVQVGPHKKTNIHAAIINPVGTLHHNGLLGMNFLRNLEYRIDFDKKEIVWKP